MTIHNDAWLAGLFEGEGCAIKLRFGMGRLSIAMVDADVIEKAREVAGFGRFSSQKLKSGKTMYIWYVACTKDVLSLIDRLLPYMFSRRAEKMSTIRDQMRSYRNSRHGTPTHCPNGHLRSEFESLRKGGRRQCLACQRKAYAVYKERLKAEARTNG